MGKLTILCGNIVDNEILSLGEAIVLPTNPMMRCGAGVSGAIFKKAGVDLLEQYCEQTFGISYYNEPGKNEMKVTDVRVTPGFSLPCKILFAQGPKRYEYINLNEALFDLKKTYENILKVTGEQGFRSLLLPALGTGEYGFSHCETAETVMKTLYDYSSENEIDLYFVVFHSSDKAIYDRTLSILC